MKFKKEVFRKMVKNEIRKMLDDDMLRGPPELGDPHYVKHSLGKDVCKTCGQTPCTCHDDPDDTSACGSCKSHPCECGYADIMERKLTCETCEGVLFLEGDCSCEKQVSMFIPSGGTFHDEGHEKPVAYMAKSQLLKITKYSQKLQHMISDNLDLDDWMRSHIAQASDDIGEVYHKLDYQLSKEED